MKPTYLYIKEHNVTGLKYFGKTTKDPYKYNGSGKHWVRHIKKHGKEHVNTVWISEPFTDESRLVEFALLMSEELDVVKSNMWANLKEENGLDGAIPGIIPWNKGIPRTEAEKQTMSNARKGIKSWNKGIPCSDETKDKLRCRSRTSETKKKIKTARAKQVITHIDSTKQKISQSHIGMRHSIESKQKMSNISKNRPNVLCPHCNMSCNIGNAKRWHFDNCKLKGNNNE